MNPAALRRRAGVRSTQLRKLIDACGAICSCMAALAVQAADSATPLISHGEPVPMPGIGRVIIGFLLTVGLALGAAYGLRRWLPRFVNRYRDEASTDVKVSTTVRNNLRIHVVSLDDYAVLIAEGRTGIAIAPLPQKSTPWSRPNP